VSALGAASVAPPELLELLELAAPLELELLLEPPSPGLVGVEELELHPTQLPTAIIPNVTPIPIAWVAFI
jgi:hypothetical protein